MSMNERINPLVPLLTPAEVSQFNMMLFRRARNVIEAIEQHPLDFPRPRWNLGCLQGSEVQAVEEGLLLDASAETIQRFISPGIRTSATDDQELGRIELRYRKMTKRWEEFISTATRTIALSCTLTSDPNYTHNELPVRTIAQVPFIDGGIVTLRPRVGLFQANLQFRGGKSYKRNIHYLRNLASIFDVRAFGHADQKHGFESIGDTQTIWYAPGEAMQPGRQEFSIDSTEALYAFLLTVRDMQIARN